MPTKHSLATYYHETPAIVEMMDQFGNHFEALTAVGYSFGYCNQWLILDCLY